MHCTNRMGKPKNVSNLIQQTKLLLSMHHMYFALRVKVFVSPETTKTEIALMVCKAAWVSTHFLLFYETFHEVIQRTLFWGKSVVPSWIEGSDVMIVAGISG